MNWENEFSSSNMLAFLYFFTHFQVHMQARQQQNELHSVFYFSLQNTNYIFFRSSYSIQQSVSTRIFFNLNMYFLILISNQLDKISSHRDVTIRLSTWAGNTCSYKRLSTMCYSYTESSEFGQAIPTKFELRMRLVWK